MSTAIGQTGDAARHRFVVHGRTDVRAGELLRHPVYSRVVHWSVAAFFVLALVSGFAIYSPWLYRWLTPLFGGGTRRRLLHPWFSVAFVALFVLQFALWLRPMSWTGDDSRWMRRLRSYVTNTEKLEPEYVGFFNAGQKLYFWTIGATAVIFLVTGIPIWFPATFGRTAVAVGYVLHYIAALVMLVGFVVHLYEGTASQPGTFHSMTRGTVSKRWAWTHHPAWYRHVTGRDPRADYERAVQQRANRAGEEDAS